MKKILRFVLALSLIFSMIGLAACSSVPGAASEGPKSENVNVETDTSITIEHELDQISIKKNPERVVVFDFGVLDILDYIEKDIVGLPKQSLPPFLDKYNDGLYRDVGTLKEPNFETIFELKPDLIIISARQASLYDEFKKIAPTLYLDFKGQDYLNSFKSNVSTLGQIFDKGELLAQEVESIEKDINAVQELASSRAVTALFVMANDGSLSVYGADSRFGIIHNEFGLAQADENIDTSTHGQKVTFEYIVEKDPDHLFVVDRAAVVGGETSAQ